MRIIHFTKIDFITAKKFAIFTLLFPVLSLIMLLKETDTGGNTPFACIYCLFAGIVVSSLPQSTQSKADNGFLKMLPSKNGDQTRGHFLFSLCCLSGFLVLALLAIGIASLIKPTLSIRQVPFPLCLLLLGVALIFTGLEALLYAVIPGSAAQATNLIRILPAFLYFFGLLFLRDLLPDAAANFIFWINPLRCGILFLICLLVDLILMEVCAALGKR